MKFEALCKRMLYTGSTFRLETQEHMRLLTVVSILEEASRDQLILKNFKQNNLSLISSTMLLSVGISGSSSYTSGELGRQEAIVRIGTAGVRALEKMSPQVVKKTYQGLHTYIYFHDLIVFYF